MTAQARTVEALRTDILTGALTPGAQLVQEDVAERLGVSRIPVREALQLLASEGLVSHQPNRGYFVTELSVVDLQEVYRLRQILEAEAIRQAVPALSDADVKRLRELAAAVPHADDIAAANRRFHFALFEAAGMPRLTRLLNQLWDSSDVYRALYFQQGANRRLVHTEHSAMLDAIERRDHSAAWVSAQLRRKENP
jgi:DNA-binding GntR family transcriptional regulator